VNGESDSEEGAGPEAEYLMKSDFGLISLDS